MPTTDEPFMTVDDALRTMTNRADRRYIAKYERKNRKRIEAISQKYYREQVEKLQALKED